MTLSLEDPTMSMFDDGAVLRDEALDVVTEHANPVWLHAAQETARRIAGTRLAFTADDVWEALDVDQHTHEPRAMGAVMKWLAAEKIAEPTGEYVPSTRPQAHCRPTSVWRSLVFNLADVPTTDDVRGQGEADRRRSDRRRSRTDVLLEIADEIAPVFPLHAQWLRNMTVEDRRSPFTDRRR